MWHFSIKTETNRHFFIFFYIVFFIIPIKNAVYITVVDKSVIILLLRGLLLQQFSQNNHL